MQPTYKPSSTHSGRPRGLRTATGALSSVAALAAVGGQASAQAIEVRLDLYSLMCDETTAEPYSDEPFIVGSWGNLRTSATGKIFQPPPNQYWHPQLGWQTVYPHFGNIDENDFAFLENRPVWRGWIQNGESIVFPLAAWEKDSNYGPGDYAEDMVLLLLNEIPTLVKGTVSPATVARAIIYSATFLFGAGASDPLGSLAVKLTNVNGRLVKQLDAGEYLHLGTAERDSFISAYVWDTSRIAYLKRLGWRELYRTWSRVYFTKKYYYGPLDASRETVRVVLDGAGGEKYQLGLQVRLGPFTSSRPNGTAALWTQTSSTSAR